MKKIPVIIDCDPGHDDAIALILAFAREELDVKAVTVSAGNQSIEKTLLNAKKVLSFIGKHPPLAAGATKPLFRKLETAAEVHGESGLDGPSLPAPDFSEEPVPAVELLRKTIMETPEPVTLIPTGPLTNIAILFTAYPEVKKNIRQISLMGGGIEAGNWTSAAEFNIFVDPEAADIVFKSELPIIMAGLDVTHKALFLREDIAELRRIGGRVPILVAELLDFFFEYHIAQDFAGAPLHDPCAVAYLVKPELFSARQYHVDIETRGEHTAGMTLADRRHWSKTKPNVTALLDVDRAGFVNLLIEAFKSYEK
ncbi:MAG: pyrimidine-specific ribonucleoside hydrolase RihA [Termitinemataceae bacterium]|nr:MAG: pyrimidine-specific ribonucleoside hydrolase RihA [Termitinemataceae bacterium]